MKPHLNSLAVAALVTGMFFSTQSFASATSRTRTVVASHAATSATEIRLADPFEDNVEFVFTGSDSTT
jgi:hypothetical protein